MTLAATPLPVAETPRATLTATPLRVAETPHATLEAVRRAPRGAAAC